MNTLFGVTEKIEAKQAVQEHDVCYEHAGYFVRVHFVGNKTLMQCMKDLAERKIEG